jgi:hypothetical protein
MDQPIPFPQTEAREYRAWLGFWVQLALLAFLAVLGLYFAGRSEEPGDDVIGLILAAAAGILAALRIKSQLDGNTGGWGSLLLVDDLPSLFVAIVLFTALALAGLIVGGTHRSVSVQDGGLALFVVSVLLVFLSMRRFFDTLETRR